MREPYGKNPELRRHFLVALLLGLTTVAANGLLLEFRVRALNREITLRLAAATGSVAASHPEAARELGQAVAAAFSSREPAAPESAGDAALTADLFLSAQPAIASLSRGLAATGTAAILLLLASQLCLLYLGMRSLFRRMRAVSRTADLVASGSPSTVPELDADGDVGELAERFNRMARRVTVTALRLERERHNLEVLISDISHQLKTPLASIKLMVDLVLQGSATGPKADEFLERSIHQVERMEWLIRSLLALARIEAGALTFRPAEAELRETVEEAVEGIRELASPRSVRIVISPEGARIAHDARWLAEALGNVVKNCVEHSPEGSEVGITISDSPALARISIHDDGAGIPPEELPRLFTRFYRGSDAPEEGTGIGLSLAKAIVEGHDGTISVASAPARGSTFTIMLPRRLTKA